MPFLCHICTTTYGNIQTSQQWREERKLLSGLALRVLRCVCERCEKCHNSISSRLYLETFRKSAMSTKFHHPGLPAGSWLNGQDAGSIILMSPILSTLWKFDVFSLSLLISPLSTMFYRYVNGKENTLWTKSPLRITPSSSQKNRSLT